MDHPADVFDVFWASGQDLRDDQILRTDHRNHRSGDINRKSPLKELLFEPGSGKHDVERHPAAAMNEGNHSSASDEIGVAENDIEPAIAHDGSAATSASTTTSATRMDGSRRRKSSRRRAATARCGRSPSIRNVKGVVQASGRPQGAGRRRCTTPHAFVSRRSGRLTATTRPGSAAWALAWPSSKISLSCTVGPSSVGRGTGATFTVRLPLAA